jgi:hypothetical protein
MGTDTEMQCVLLSLVVGWLVCLFCLVICLVPVVVLGVVVVVVVVVLVLRVEVLACLRVCFAMHAFYPRFERHGICVTWGWVEGMCLNNTGRDVCSLRL